jgi:AraC-like DNA-binding protein
MDALSDVLRVMRLKGGVFLHGEFSDPWCLGVTLAPDSCTPYLGPSAHLIAYHYVLEGHMRVRMGDGTELDVAAGQSVLFPRNDPHVLGSDLELDPVPGERVVQSPADGGLERIVLGGGGAPTRIVCGFLGTEDVRGNPVIAALPAALRLDVRHDVAAEWVRNTFRYAADEIAAGRLGSETVMAKLSELLLVEAIRRYAETLPEQATGWLAGLRDPFLSRAIARLHADIAAPWTVEELGRQVGLSRSALSDRSASRRCSTSPHGGSRWRRTSCSRAESRSRRWRSRSATSRRRRLHERSSASSACHLRRGGASV